MLRRTPPALESLPFFHEAKLLLDRDYYLGANPDVAEAGLDPLHHFLSSGLQEGRSPSRIFSKEFYEQENADVMASQASAILHFLETGGIEGRSPHPLFNAQYYLTKNPDIAEAGLNPLLHYLEAGYQEGRNPHPLFDSQYYLNTNPDIAQQDLNPFVHFLSAPSHEKRNPNPIFDIHFYGKNHPDVHQTGESLLLHYIDFGDRAGAKPHPLFDPNYYTAQINSEQGDHFNALIHYFMAGPLSDAKAHPLVDQKYYRERVPEIINHDQTPLAHYLTIGAANGQDPCAIFQTWWYADQYLSGDAQTINPLAHFVSLENHIKNNPNPYFLSNWYLKNFMDDTTTREQLPLMHYIQACEDIRLEIINGNPISNAPNPNPWLDTAWYFIEHQDILYTESNPLSHYIEAGARENRKPSPYFDAQWYIGKNDTYGLNALEHFLSYGAIEGLAPNEIWQKAREQGFEGVEVNVSTDQNGETQLDPRQYKILSDSDFFDEAWYRAKYLSPQNINMDPIEHYLIFGTHIGYDPGPNFSTNGYRTVNHDLRSAQINPLLHYIQHGRFEGRQSAQEQRDNQVKNFRFSQAEYGPITDILEYDSDALPPSHLSESLCLHLHFFHTDMAEEFCDLINHLTIPFTLLVSIQPDEDETEWEQYFNDHIHYASSIIVKACVNQGRDVQPWLVAFKQDIQAHDIFIHLHTKKSGYNKFQQSWRRYLTHTVFGTRTIVNQILNLFADHQDTGLVAPAYFYILRNQPNYGKNYDQYERLYMALFGDVPSETCPDYPAGSFFWARTKMLEPLFDLDLQIEDFDEEDGQVDGTIAHALERILGALPAYTDYQLRCIAIDVPFDLVHYIHPARVETLNPDLLLPPAFLIEADDRPTYPAIKKKKIAVYSAITGGYESFIKPLIIDPNIDYFLFTDTPEKFDPDWATVIEMPYIAHTPVRTARYAKTHPHFWFPDYDYAIWMDANVLPTTSLYQFIDKIEGTEHHAAFISHPLRFNCLEEGHELIKFKIDDQKIIEEQLARYGKMPEVFQQELIETNFFVCRPKLEVTRKFMTHWWSELNNYSHRDQLSIAYALTKSHLNWVSLFEDNISIRDHSDFFLLEHEMHNRNQFIAKLTQSIQARVSEDPEGLLAS